MKQLVDRHTLVGRRLISYFRGVSKAFTNLPWQFQLMSLWRISWWSVVIISLAVLVVVIGLKTIPENRLIINYFLALLGLDLGLGLFIAANSTIMTVMRIQLLTLELVALGYYLLVTIAV